MAWDFQQSGMCTNKASDQPAHTRSLIKAFASRLNILWVLRYWLNINSGLQIFFKIGRPKWPIEQKMVGHFLKWWAQAYQTNRLYTLPTHWHRHLYAYTYIDCWLYSKTCLKRPLKKEDQLSLNVGQKYCRMLQGEHSAILLIFIKLLPFVIKIFVLSFFEWLLKTCFTVLTNVLWSS